MLFRRGLHALTLVTTVDPHISCAPFAQIVHEPFQAAPAHLLLRERAFCCRSIFFGWAVHECTLVAIGCRDFSVHGWKPQVHPQSQAETISHESIQDLLSRRKVWFQGNKRMGMAVKKYSRLRQNRIRKQTDGGRPSLTYQRQELVGPRHLLARVGGSDERVLEVFLNRRLPNGDTVKSVCLKIEGLLLTKM